MDDEIVKLLRIGLAEELKKYSREKLASFKLIKNEYVEKLIFNMDIDLDGNTVKRFAFPLELMKALNFEGINFDNFDARGFDFSNLYGVTLNPQKVYKKDLSYAKLKGVTINGSFEDTITDGTDFKNHIMHIDSIKSKKHKYNN